MQTEPNCVAAQEEKVKYDGEEQKEKKSNAKTIKKSCVSLCWQL